MSGGCFHDLDMDEEEEEMDEGFYAEDDSEDEEYDDDDYYVNHDRLATRPVGGTGVVDRGGMFGQLAETFGTQKTPRDKGPCMFCRLLHADPLPGWREIPNAEYFFGLEDEDILRLDYERYQCSLYHSMLDFYRTNVLTQRASGQRFIPTCHQFRSICTEDDIFHWRWDDNREALVLPDPLDPKVITRVREWIDRCQRDHKTCHDAEIHPMPTRVIDVGDSEESPVVKVIDTHGQRAEYIALSHCWGKTQSFVTTRENITDMRRGFNMNGSPKTFRDAIIVTRKLGIRYLWIDSLCIIQKDLEDWQIESAKMGSVYRNAYLTIAAEDATADEEGFLHERGKATSSLEVLFETGHLAKVYLRPEHIHKYRSSYQIDDGALRSRGWCLQEAYLSRRLLKFFNNRIVFTCQEFTLDEGVHDKFHERDGDEETIDRILPKYEYRKPFPKYQKWYDLVEAYSKRNLSFASDRLPALSGLASLVADRQKAEYLAGIWWEEAIFGLCWRADHRKPLKRSESYLAPSWSWASVIGPISFYNAKLSFVDLYALNSVRLMDYNIDFSGPNQFGQVNGGWIKLAAPLAPISILDESSLGDGEDTLLYDFEDRPDGDLSLLFLMWDERDSDGVTRKDIMDLIGIVVSRTEDSQLKKNGEIINQKYFPTYKKVGLFELERSSRLEDSIARHLPKLVKEVVLV